MQAELFTARLNKIESLRPAILDGGDRAQQMRRLPDDLVNTLIDEGFFRFTLPNWAVKTQLRRKRWRSSKPSPPSTPRRPGT